MNNMEADMNMEEDYEWLDETYDMLILTEEVAKQAESNDKLKDTVKKLEQEITELKTSKDMKEKEITLLKESLLLLE